MRCNNRSWWVETGQRSRNTTTAGLTVLVCILSWGSFSASCAKEEQQANNTAQQARVEADAGRADACVTTENKEAGECHYQRLARQFQRRDFRPSDTALRKERLSESERPRVRAEGGDPLRMAVELEDDGLRSETARELKKKGVIAVLDSKMKKKSSLSNILGKDRNLAVKNAVWSEKDQHAPAGDGEAGPGPSGGAGGFGGGGGGGGFGSGGAFGMGGMGGVGSEAQPSGKSALTGLKDRNRKRSSKVKLGSGSMGQFCKKADVQRKVKGRAAAIRACYEMQLQNKPELAGKVTVQWIIDLTGKVKGVKTVQNTTGNKKLDGCISRLIKKIHFQPPKGGMCIVRWPFVFSPGS
jgi:hypothetical protein